MRVAIVTGAAKGLGRTYALALAEDGWSVVAADVLDAGPVVEEIAAAGGDAIAVPTDVSEEQAVEFLHYVASKSAIVGLTRALARELGDWGICVNAIAPDYVPHDAEYAAQQPEMAARLARERCFQRDMTPDDLVGTLRYLVDPGSAFVTGQVLYVNGGRVFSGV
jgi:3-oxoacyl-[acyl-carrier protein] reductase